MARNNITDILMQAKNGIQNVFDSEHYKECLRVMGKFHNYSVRNIMLIKSERPDATYVAGYQTWQREFGRHVKKGERGIPIIAYSPRKKFNEEKVKDENGKESIKVAETIIPDFRVVYVYDVSQTEGQPLPKLTEHLIGNMKNYEALFQSIKDISPYPIHVKEITSEASGYCSPANKEIVIREGMSQRQTIKTAIHQVAHACMHTDKEVCKKEKLDERTIEVEAEAVAYAVCEHFGMDTSSYSFPYIASWSSGKDLKELENSLDRIQHGASDIIKKVEARYLELEPPLPETSKSVKPEMANALTADHMLTADQMRACISYGLPVGYFVAEHKVTGQQLIDVRVLADMPKEEFDKKYDHVYRDVKLVSQVKDGLGKGEFCYPENGCVSPTINPYVMNPAEVASTKFLLTEFARSEDWNRIDEMLKYNAPVRYADMEKVRDKFFDEQYFVEAAKNYPGKTIDEIRTLAGFLTITEDSREVYLPGHRGAWLVADSAKINGENFYLMYNDNSKLKEVIVDQKGTILMDRRCSFDDLKDRLDEEARMNGSHEKQTGKGTKTKSKNKER